MKRAEMRTVLPIHLLALDQADVGFIDERAGLQFVAGSFAAQIVMRHAAQFVVNQWHQLVGGLRVTLASGGQHLGLG